MKFISLLLAFVATACVSTRENPNIPNLTSEHEYYSAVSNATRSDKIYDGLTQILDVSATLHNSEVSKTQLDQNARIYQWSETDYQNKKSEMETNSSKQTQVFISFFVPERKHDNLARVSSAWKIFLTGSGKRVEGKVEKIKMIPTEIMLLYPHHNRFSTPYRVTFPIPVSMVESAESTFVMTGPVGSVKLTFPPAR